MELQVCSKCGAELEEGKSCEDYFHQLLAWDFGDFPGAGADHHLTVLCYYIQHPSLYSREALVDAIEFLQNIVESGMTRDEMYERNKQQLASTIRDWKISGTDDNHGSYASPIHWSMTVRDVVNGGVEDYLSNLKRWSESIYADLKKFGNLE